MYCCTTPLLPGPGNFTNAPLFMNTNGWSNLRLQSNSPCINAGSNAYAPGLTDLDGNPRIAGATVDLGAYEFQGTGLSSFTGWLWQYGLPTDGSSDYAAPDHDGMNNWQEWLAGTNPTNALSVLRFNPPLIMPSGLQLRWSSASGQAYFVQRATNLGGPLSFRLLQANIPGLPGTTTYMDTTAPTVLGAFYRVGTGASNSVTPPSLQAPA